MNRTAFLAPDALAGRTAVVTGASRGAGKGIAAYRDFEQRFPSDPRAGDVNAKVQALEAAAAALPPPAP